jgi:elongation factor P--(R)-beta-lysine ligase
MAAAAASDRGARLRARDCVLRALRRFFYEHDYCEVETPVRVATPALEAHIDAEPAGAAFLRTSPELHMKRLLAEGMERIFQVGPCFRRGENGRHHRPEYTMLEWYRRDAGYLDTLDETRDLLQAVCRDTLGRTDFLYAGARVNMASTWRVETVADIFVRCAGWNPVAQFDADRFDLDLVNKIEPALPPEIPCVLKDYPVAAAALARCRAETPPVAERWELYAGGMELANAFGELTDAKEQRRRFEQCARERGRRGQPVYALDEDFLAALEKGMPACSGVALGVDRLVMLLTDRDDIAAVRAF